MYDKTLAAASGNPPVDSCAMVFVRKTAAFFSSLWYNRAMSDASGASTPAPPLQEAVYAQMRAIARQRLAGESPAHTLQATALVHEAYLRLQRHEAIMALDRSAFLAAAAEAMRRILVDHARTKKRIKRGAGVKPKLLDVAQLAEQNDPDLILSLDEAICRLEGVDPGAAQVVRLRFFAGLSVEETAEVLKVSDRTVKRDWAFARAWLYEQLQES